MKRTRLLAGATLAVAVALPAMPASANDDDVIRRGDCSRKADWKLKASPEDGRIEVEGEVDSNRRGQTWRWRIEHNGSVSAAGTKDTRGRSGSFEVRRVLVDLRGVDRVGFRAENTQTGETCRGVVNY